MSPSKILQQRVTINVPNPRIYQLFAALFAPTWNNFIAFTVFVVVPQKHWRHIQFAWIRTGCRITAVLRCALPLSLQCPDPCEGSEQINDRNRLQPRQLFGQSTKFPRLCHHSHAHPDHIFVRPLEDNCSIRTLGKINKLLRAHRLKNRASSTSRRLLSFVGRNENYKNN